MTARIDPTGLADVRRSLRAETDRRWNGLRRHVRRTIVGKDGLSVGPTAPTMARPSTDKAAAFRSWLSEQLSARVGSAWMDPHLATAAARASSRVGRLVGAASSPPSSLPVCRAATALHAGRVQEDAAREAHDAVLANLLANPQSGKIARAADQALLRGRRRARVLAEHAATQAYTQASLDAFQAAGIDRVGSVSEHIAARMVTDAATLTKARALYVDSSSVPGQDCAGCSMFRSPSACTLVEGPVEPAGWCAHWDESSILRAAGILYVDPTNSALFLRRTDDGTWALPGGCIEAGETPEIAAVREGMEEVGGVPVSPLTHLTTSSSPVEFHTFRQDVQTRFSPSLNHEHDAAVWAPLSSPPAPLHPGVAWTLRTAGLMDAAWESEDRDDHGKWTSGGGKAKSFAEWHQPVGASPAPAEPKPLSYSPEALKTVQQGFLAAAEANHGQESWADHPRTDAEWAAVPGRKLLEEPPLTVDPFTTKTGEVVPDKHQRLASGVVVREPDGKIWLVHPKNSFGGYKATFPKGGVDPGLSPQANAIKEAYEETGLKVRITGLLGDFRRTTSKTRYYEAERVGGNVKDHGWETDKVSLVDPADLHVVADHPVDRPVIEAILGHRLTDAFDPDEPRDEAGKWTAAGYSLRGTDRPDDYILEHLESKRWTFGSSKDQAMAKFKEKFPAIVKKSPFPPAMTSSTPTPSGPSEMDVIKKVTGYDDEEVRINASNIMGEGFKGTKAEAAALSYYTGGSNDEHSGIINRALHSGTLTEEQKVYVRVLNSALSKIKPYAGTVRRAVELTPEQLAKYKVGETIIDPGFQSTSKTSPWGGNAQFKIDTRHGVDVDRYSDSPGEDEILIPAGTRMTVLSHEVDEKGVHRIHLKDATSVTDAPSDPWWRSLHSGKFVSKAHRAAIDPEDEWVGPDEGQFDVITQEDDRVCQECEDIAASGPYDIDTARDLVPVHPSCRCVWLPA